MAAVYIPDTGVLVLGEEGRSPYRNLKETELLICESDGEKDNWTWRCTAPMLGERGLPRAIYFQQRVHVAHRARELYENEMLNL